MLAGSRGMQKMDLHTRTHSVYMDANGRKYYAEGEEREIEKPREKSGLVSEGQRLQVYFVCHAVKKVPSSC